MDAPLMPRVFLNPYPGAQAQATAGVPLVNITTEYRERVVFPAPSQEEFAAVAMLSSFQESCVPPSPHPPSPATVSHHPRASTLLVSAATCHAPTAD